MLRFADHGTHAVAGRSQQRRFDMQHEQLIQRQRQEARDRDRAVQQMLHREHRQRHHLVLDLQMDQQVARVADAGGQDLEHPALPAGLRDFVSGPSVIIDPREISLSVGPFEVFSDEVDNLDVSRDLFDAYERSMDGGGRDTILFVTGDYLTWLQVEHWPGGDDLVAAMTATADGYLADTWFWGNGGGPFESTDGVVWTETELPAGHGSISWFGTHDGRLLMLGDPEAVRAVYRGERLIEVRAAAARGRSQALACKTSIASARRAGKSSCWGLTVMRPVAQRCCQSAVVKNGVALTGGSGMATRP